MQVGGSPAAFLEFLPAAAWAGFVAPHLWLHGFRDRALVDCDPEWPSQTNKAEPVSRRPAFLRSAFARSFASRPRFAFFSCMPTSQKRESLRNGMAP